MYYSFKNVKKYFLAGTSETSVIKQFSVTHTDAVYYSAFDLSGDVARDIFL